MTLRDLLIPTYRNTLRALGGMIDKAAAHETGEALLDERLAADMFPLAHQFRFLANLPGESLAKLTGVAFTSHDTDPGSLGEARVWLSQTLLHLDTVADADWMAEDEAFDLMLPNGMHFHLTAAQYVRDWVLPNFYFHASIAYAILRGKGVALGKGDLVPHMGQYFKRPQ